MSLMDKKIVLLGGTSGFGLAAAQAAAREGAKVVVVSSRQESVEGALSKLPANAVGLVANLADPASYQGLFDKIGRFDHLAFTAGDPLAIMPLDAVTLDQARKAFELRFWGAFMAAKTGAPLINEGGSITFTSGTAGQRPPKGWSVVAALVAALEGLTRGLAVELAPIRVNAVCAGVVDTNLWAGMPAADRQAFFDHYASMLPTGRIGRADDIGDAYVFLMKQGFATGQTIVVDGGGVLV